MIEFLIVRDYSSWNSPDEPAEYLLMAQSGHQQIDLKAGGYEHEYGRRPGGLVGGIVKEILRESVPVVANGVPGDGEEARAKVHTDDVAARWKGFERSGWTWIQFAPAGEASGLTLT